MQVDQVKGETQLVRSCTHGTAREEHDTGPLV